jgi:hypothetical protein
MQANPHHVDFAGCISFHARSVAWNASMVTSKPIRLTGHAAVAVAERKLLHSWIEAAVQNPDWAASDPQWKDVERRFRAIPEYDNRILRVDCLETPTETHIITAFFDRKARRPA